MELDDLVEGQNIKSSSKLKEAFIDRQKYTDILKNKKLVERKPEASLICSRCHSLKNESKLLEYKVYQNVEEDGQGIKSGQVVKLSDHVANFNRDGIIRNIFKQVYHGSIIMYVIDITNFEGSQIDEIYELINKKKCRVMIIVNKIDALPNSFKVSNL